MKSNEDKGREMAVKFSGEDKDSLSTKSKNNGKCSPIGIKLSYITSSFTSLSSITISFFLHIA